MFRTRALRRPACQQEQDPCPPLPSPPPMGCDKAGKLTLRIDELEERTVPGVVWGS